MEEREALVSTSLQTTGENQSKVDTLEAEVDEAIKATLNMEEKVAENEAKLARLLGDQASLRLDYLNLKRAELEKSSQLREARVVLKQSEDKSRKAQTELMATLCERALVASQTRPALATVPGTATEVATAEVVVPAAEAAPVAVAAQVAEATPATVAAPVSEATGAEGTKTAEAVSLEGATSINFPALDTREKDR